MKKLKLFSRSSSLFFILLLCFTGSASAHTPEDVKSVQFNVIKTSTEKMGNIKLIRLWNCLQTVMADECAEEITFQKEEPYYTICLAYEDGTKDVFYFFCDNNDWYMEAPDHNIYKDAAFITSYIQTSSDAGEQAGGLVLTAPLPEILQLDPLFENRDWRYFFTEAVFAEMEKGSSEREAVERAEQKLQKELKLYQYARKNGQELSEHEFEEMLELHISALEEADNYEEISEVWQKAGTSLRQDILKSEQYYRVRFTIDKLYAEKYEEFKEGKDRIKQKECWSFAEYWNTFDAEIVSASLEQSELAEIEMLLDEAKDYYQKHF